MSDNYKENESRIPDVNPNIDKYDSMSSRLRIMSDIIDTYNNSYDHITRAEIEYERLRTENKEALIRVNLEDQLSQAIGGLTIGGVFESPGQAAIETALNTIRSTTLARAVGPIEELPFTQLQDGIRREIILSDTQIEREQALLAKLSAGSGNTLNPFFDYEMRQAAEDAISGRKDRNRADSEMAGDEYQIVEGIGVRQRKKDAMYDVVDGVGVQELTNKWSRNSQYVKPELAYEEFPFKIYNRATGKSEIFPAYIESLNEDFSPQWNTLSFINRSEDIYVYQRATRSYNIGIILFSANDFSTTTAEEVSEEVLGYSVIPTDVPSSTIDVISKEDMWRKINFINQCVYPTYAYGESGTQRLNKAPYLKLWLGNLYNGIDIIIESLNISYEPIVWNLNADIGSPIYGAGIKPMIARIVLGGKILHGSAPDGETNFYRGDSSNNPSGGV